MSKKLTTQQFHRHEHEENVKRTEETISRFSKQLCRQNFGNRNNHISHEDVKQNALLKVAKSLLKGRNTEGFSNAQLWVLTKNSFMDLCKSLKRKRRLLLHTDDLSESLELSAPEKAFILDYENYLKIINFLVQTEVIILIDSQKKLLDCINKGFVRPTEIADELNISLNSACARLNKLTSTIKEQITFDILQQLKGDTFGGFADF